jgi:predicted signal transduction protein with EAL and GGDEF domain
MNHLLNRRGFDDAAQRLIVQARCSRKPVSALMCDIDMFKQVNDTQGHEGGDAAIRHVADIVAKALESVPDSVVGRQGGDEAGGGAEVGERDGDGGFGAGEGCLQGAGHGLLEPLISWGGEAAHDFA